MPRAKRQIFAEVTIDRATEETLAMIERLGPPSPDQEVATEARAQKFSRRVGKARRRWHALSDADRREWTAAYVSERSRRTGSVKPPKLADLPMLFAIATVCEKDNARSAAEHADRESKRAAAEAQRTIEAAERRAAEPAKPVSSRPERGAECVDGAETGTDTRRHRKYRRGPAFGVVAVQMPDGSMRAPIYDDDDL